MEKLKGGANCHIYSKKGRKHYKEMVWDSDILFKSGEPCDHPGCLNHITHPCEGCGRVAGEGNILKQSFEEPY